MWVTPSRDPTYAELAAREAIHGGGGLSANLTKPLPTIADQIGTLVKAIAPAVASYIQTKKSDQIANQLMNMENPPRAQAVDQYGATYDPSLARNQGLMSQTDPAATNPFTGGAQGMKVQNAYQAFLDQQQADKLKAAQDEQKSRLTESQIAKNYDPGEPKYSVQLPDGRIINVTGNEAAQYYKPRASANSNDWSRSIAVARGAINDGKLDKDKPVGQFTNQYSGAENGDMVLLSTPTGQTMVVPWKAYQERTKNPALKTYQDAQTTLPEPDLPAVGPSTIPDVPGSSIPSPTATGKKPLDAQTAKALLVETGGDKDKARRLAIERGYTF